MSQPKDQDLFGEVQLPEYPRVFEERGCKLVGRGMSMLGLLLEKLGFWSKYEIS